MKKNTKRCLCAFLAFTTLLAPNIMGCAAKKEESNLSKINSDDPSYYLEDRAIIKIGNEYYDFKIKYHVVELGGSTVVVTFEDGYERTIAMENFWSYNSHDDTMNSIVEEQKIMKK